MGLTLLDKIWNQHVIADLGEGWALLHIDRHILHDLSGPPALLSLKQKGLPLHDRQLAFATPDHAVSSAPDRTGDTFAGGARLYWGLKMLAQDAGVRLFDLGEPGQGIVHVMGPELGLVLPGVTLICGDSHTCTNGGLGALAFGVGTSESAHALATQTLRMRKPKQMRIVLEGVLCPGVTPKDVILHVIGALGAAAGVEHMIEFTGAAVAAMSVEERLTLCNLAVELGARSGIVAPDQTTIDYLRERPYSPQGQAFETAARAWRMLSSDPDARFDKEASFDVSAIAPTITWGTSPQHTAPITGHAPDPAAAADPMTREAQAAALDYMGLAPGQALAGTPVDWVFIGSCANSRISDLRAAAGIVAGRHVAEGVTAWVVPGSTAVKAQAEAEGLHEVFTAAGFSWREPGCSMCVAANGERAPSGARIVSTSNRNFVGRQGPGARTHLASPVMAAAAAVTGKLVDVREI